MVDFRNNYSFFGLIAVVIVLDQCAKYLIQSYVQQEIVLIPRILSLTHLMNTGASFGIFRGMNAFLTVLGLLVIAFLFYYLSKHPSERHVPFALVIGGAISNVFDRIARGFVIDFIQIPFWPSFNIADSAITIGVIAIIMYSLQTKK